MNLSIVIWCVVAVAMAVMLLVRLVKSCKAHTHHHFFEIGSERDEMFLPGDDIREDVLNEDD